MANFGKLKKNKSALGGATPPTDESGNLDAPEVAPRPQLSKKIDGRSLNKTGRTELLSVRTTPETVRRFKVLAKSKGLKLAEAMEQAIDLWEESTKS